MGFNLNTMVLIWSVLLMCLHAYMWFAGILNVRFNGTMFWIATFYFVMFLGRCNGYF